MAVVALVLYALAYRFYSKFLATKIFVLDPKRKTPAHEFEDDVDYMPTNKSVLWGHHFSSIAGAAPMLGPAIAVIWGWLPALLWVIFGTILLGGVHDFGSLVVSARHQGRSIGDVAGDLVGERARNLFLLIIFFLLLLVLAVFAIIIAIMFEMFPVTVIPIWCEMIIAVCVGFTIYKTKIGTTLPGIIAVIVMYITIVIGAYYPITIPALFGTVKSTWIFLVLIYAFIASVLPVWILLQPRDHINAHELIIGLALMYIGLLVVQYLVFIASFHPGRRLNRWITRAKQE
jgi:carbon starvation protein